MAAAGTIRLSGPGSGCAGFGDIFTQPGMIGAADLKLVALLAAWLGFSETIKILCVGFILGAVWSLQKMLRYGSAFQRFLYLSAYIRQILSNKKIEKYYDPVRDGTECVIPLGTCFCMATVLVFLEKWIF